MRLIGLLLCAILLGQFSSCVSQDVQANDAAGSYPAAPGGLAQQPPLMDSKTLPTTVAWILFGGVVMIMMAFYLVSYKDIDISDATWLVISNAISLFCAVLLFLAFRELVALATDGDDIQERRLGPADDADWSQCWGSASGTRRLADIFQSRRLAAPPTQKTLTVDILCVVFMFVAWEATLFFVRTRKTSLSGLGLVAGHCIGFSTLYAFGNMQQCEPFREGPVLSLQVVIVALVVVTLLCCISHVIRQRMTSALHTHHCCHLEHHDVHNWHHQCSHTEREAAAFAVSFLIAQVLEFVATRELAPLHNVPKGRDPGDAIVEVWFVVGLSICVVATGFAEHRVAAHHGHDELVAHKHGHEMTRLQLGLHMLKDTLAFTVGWCLLCLIKLTFWSATNDQGLLGGGDVMTSHLVLVFISSVVTFTTFFVIDFAADRIHGDFGRGLRSLGKAFMLLLGLAWEGAFWEGAHSMSQGMGLESQTSRMLTVALVSLVLCAVVMPAWIIYIVPHTFEVEEDEVHMKDYDSHDSPAHKTTPRTASMITMTGEAEFDDATDSRSTNDEECPDESHDNRRHSLSTGSSDGCGDAHDAPSVQVVDLEAADGTTQEIVAI